MSADNMTLVEIYWEKSKREIKTDFRSDIYSQIIESSNGVDPIN